MDPTSPAQIILALLAFWCGVCVAISLFGGWWSLSQRYGAKPGRVRKQWSFQTAAMRWMTGYGGCLRFGVTERGLALSILFLFRPGHPPLLIPWEDIHAERVRVWSMDRIRLKFARAPGVPLYLSRGLAREINGASGGRWNVG